MLQLSSGYIIAACITVAFVILYPLVLAAITHQRLQVSWRYFGYGALIFLLFQLITRVPLVVVISPRIAPLLVSSPVLLYVWLLVLSLTAGLFEEVGRYVGYRWLMRREEKTWNKAVMYGLGHGGLESIVLVGGLAALQLFNLVALSSTGLDALPAAQRSQVAQAFATINAQPAWLPLLGAWERLWTIPVQVALSVIVLQVFRRGKIAWLWLAILAHTVVDFTSVALNQALGPGHLSTELVVELVVCLFGVIAIWIIWRLRDKPVVATAPEFEPSSP